MMYFWILAGAALIVLVAVFLLRRRRTLSRKNSETIRSLWAHASSLGDAHRQVVEADAVFGKALTLLSVPGGVGDQLKRAGARFSNLDELWWAHKLRNRLAHEPGMQVSESDRKRALRAFEQALSSVYSRR